MFIAGEPLPYRCGRTDVQRSVTDVLAAKWRKHELTYCVVTYIPGIPASVYDRVIAAAFSGWTAVAGLSIRRVQARDGADMALATGRGPRAGFDGKGRVAAWAELPAGDDRQLLMRFDADEVWTEELLRSVAAHEFGHLLGLDHSRLRTALMYPYANLAFYKPQPEDDIPRIQDLYGPATAFPPVPPPPAAGSIRPLTSLTAEVTARWYELRSQEDRDALVGMLAGILNDRAVAAAGSILGRGVQR